MQSPTTPTALVTGVTGQDGSFLAEQLIADGYAVVGTTRPAARTPPTPSSSGQSDRLASSHLRIVEMDLADAETIDQLVAETRPQEIYHLAAQSSVAESFDNILSTSDANALGPVRIFDAARRFAPTARICFASSCHIFNPPADVRCNESTAIAPQSPYGMAKAFAHAMATHYRDAHGMHVSNAILFNHESERRPAQFVTRTITAAAAAISLGHRDTLELLDLSAKRDWGWAPDYTRAMRLMVAKDKPDDYVIATGISHSVADLCEMAFSHVGLDWRNHVTTSATPGRTNDAPALIGDPDHANQSLQWKPTRSLRAIIASMVEADIAQLSTG